MDAAGRRFARCNALAGAFQSMVGAIADDVGEVCVTVRAASASGARAWFASPAARECVSRDI
jgi:hypothetical protein